MSVDRASEKLGAKIRLARLDRVPYMLVIGAQEAETNSVSVRHRDRENLGTQSLDEFVNTLTDELKNRSL